MTFYSKNSVFYFLYSRLLLLLLLSVFYFLFSASTVFAARLFFETDAKDLGTAQQFKIILKLDVESQNINAVEGIINFSKNLEVISVSDEGSVIALWVKKPKIADDNKIVFAGIIPGGYQGDFGASWRGIKPGKVLNIVFKVKAEGENEISLSNVRVLLNNGLGDETKTTLAPFVFESVNLEKKTPLVLKHETVLPDEFSPEISRDPNIFENRWFLVFSTHDKDSGINHYEILEKDQRPYMKWFRAEKWTVAESPYLLKDQKLKSAIYVKAVDNAGNERIEKIDPKNPPMWYENIFVWGMIVLILLSLGFVFRRTLW